MFLVVALFPPIVKPEWKKKKIKNILFIIINAKRKQITKTIDCLIETIQLVYGSEEKKVIHIKLTEFETCNHWRSVSMTPPLFKNMLLLFDMSAPTLLLAFRFTFGPILHFSRCCSTDMLLFCVFYERKRNKQSNKLFAIKSEYSSWTNYSSFAYEFDLIFDAVPSIYRQCLVVLHSNR